MRSVGSPRAWDPEVIDQAIPELADASTTSPARFPKNRDDPPVPLSPSDMKAWTGERFTSTAAGGLDRSDTLYWIGCGVARGLDGTNLSKPAKRTIIEEAVAERDQALGYAKYAGRGDSAAQYATIAAKALGEVESQPAIGISKNGTKDHASGAQNSPFGGRGPGVIKLLADVITGEDRFAQDSGGKLYRFAKGVYRQYAERYIRRRVKEVLEEQGASDKWSSHRANEVVEYIRADAPELWERPPLDEVNVLNGILNVKNRELREHAPTFLSSVQIPVTYDPNARCPQWEKFVSDVFPEDAQELAFELAADLITPSRSAQKAILLLGEGSNGKSTYLRALTAFVGSTNAGGVSLHKLESDRFATARLMGKLANICPDLPSTHLTETSVFKAITGGDDLHAEYKYRESFEFRPYCRLVFSANHVPRSGDASHAFFRRWLVVPLERTFEPGEQVPREVLDARLSSPDELSGVLNRALEVLPRVRREGFTESDSMREAWEEFKAMTDPVSVWVENNAVEHAEALVPKSALVAAYNRDCEKQGRAGMTSKAFGQALKRARPQLRDAQRTVAGKLVWCWVGIGLRQDDPPSDGSPGSRRSRDSTNCFVFEETPQKQDREGGEDPEETNKENRVNRVNGVNTDQEERIRKLVDEGMSEKLAREEVLGKGWVEP